MLFQSLWIRRASAGEPGVLHRSPLFRRWPLQRRTWSPHN
jgi:hypothetical protein